MVGRIISSCGHVKFDILTGFLNENVKSAVKYVSGTSSLDIETDSQIFSVMVALEATEMEISPPKGESVAKEKERSQD